MLGSQSPLQAVYCSASTQPLLASEASALLGHLTCALAGPLVCIAMAPLRAHTCQLPAGYRPQLPCSVVPAACAVCGIPGPGARRPADGCPSHIPAGDRWRGARHRADRGHLPLPAALQVGAACCTRSCCSRPPIPPAWCSCGCWHCTDSRWPGTACTTRPGRQPLTARTGTRWAVLQRSVCLCALQMWPLMGHTSRQSSSRICTVTAARDRSSGDGVAGAAAAHPTDLRSCSAAWPSGPLHVMACPFTLCSVLSDTWLDLFSHTASMFAAGAGLKASCLAPLSLPQTLYLPWPCSSRCAASRQHVLPVQQLHVERAAAWPCGLLRRDSCCLTKALPVALCTHTAQALHPGRAPSQPHLL